jgi:hypothetical protein
VELDHDDRRRAVRVNPGPLRVRLLGRWEGVLINISELGALVQLPIPQPPKTRITLELEWEHVTLQLTGHVVRSSPPPLGGAPKGPVEATDYYVAVEFDPVPAESTATLLDIVHQ